MLSITVAGTTVADSSTAFSTKTEARTGALASCLLYDFALLKKELSCKTSVDDMRTIKGHGGTYASMQKTSLEPLRDIARPNGKDSL